MNTKTCLKCNKEFLKKATCSKKEWLLSKYCSHSCSSATNSKGNKNCVGKTPWNKGLKFTSNQNLLTVVCRTCEGYFKVRLYRKDTAKFCSTACHNLFKDKGITPANEKVRKSSAYKAWRTLVFERDNYTCQGCSIHGGYLHADHIKPFALYPELRLEVSNGRTLCVPCHKKTDTYGRKSIYRDVIAYAIEA